MINLDDLKDLPGTMVRWRGGGVTQAHHEAAVETALERGKDLGAQEMFEACVRAMCHLCNRGVIGRFDNNRAKYWHGKTMVLLVCDASSLRLANPDRSRRMDEGAK